MSDSTAVHSWSVGLKQQITDLVKEAAADMKAEMESAVGQKGKRVEKTRRKKKKESSDQSEADSPELDMRSRKNHRRGKGKKHDKQESESSSSVT